MTAIGISEGKQEKITVIYIIASKYNFLKPHHDKRSSKYYEFKW